MQWTALDLKNLAAIFDDMADAVLAFRKQNSDTMTPEQKNQLTELFGQLVLAGEQLENQALQNALLDIQSSVTDLQNAAHEATHALQVITDVQNVICIAVAAVGVGAAIMKPTPGTLANSIGTLVQAVKQAAAKPAGSSK
ncbi:MAG: hypothetical protein ACLPND_15685 [Candidatus Korobacteraceae bacterium]|jgi:hypothetical protein